MHLENKAGNGGKKEEKTGIVLLAGGLSKRLGQPKQLLKFKGKSLLQHAVQTAVASAVGPVVVVLGARAETLKNELTESKVEVVVNEAWQEGMAASLRCGIDAFVNLHPTVNGIVLMVCDQPFVTPALLLELLTAHWQTGKPIVACNYAGTYGPPAFFHRTLFPELLKLQGDVGARRVIQLHADAVAIVPFEEGSLDIDTEEDFKKLSEK